MIEPFVGSGAVFLNTNYSSYVLSDASDPLMEFYIELRRSKQCIYQSADYFSVEDNTPFAYKMMRDLYNMSVDPTERAALLIYLNRHCFNGLFRFSRKSGFNVPFGKYKKPYFPAEELMAMHYKLQGAHLLRGDFEAVMDMAKEGSALYADPPYIPVSDTANFTGYNGEAFSADDHLRLRNAAQRAANRGVTVVLSNHSCPLSHMLYKDADYIETFSVASQMSCDGSNRRPREEMLVVYKGKAVPQAVSSNPVDNFVLA